MDGEGTGGGRGPRILMLPWLAHGHISPFVELGKRLSLRGFDVYLCSSPVNLFSLRQQYSHAMETLLPITLVELHLPELPDLPPPLHTTKYLPPHLMATLKSAFDLSLPSFLDVLRSVRPDVLLYDFLQPWAPTAASRLGIPSALFLTTGATCMVLIRKHTARNRMEEEEHPLPALLRMEEAETERLVSVLRCVSNDLSDGERVAQCIENSSSLVLIKSFREIEGPYIDYLEKILLLQGKELVPVGPLVKEQVVDQQSHGLIMEWLEKKERASVVLASFGTEYFLEEEELRVIARGLESGGLEFIWVVRYPQRLGGEEGNSTEDVKRILPVGLCERGLVVDWAPQGAILAHPSTGAFMTHCGWSSVTEGMWYGVPMVAVPLQLDQPLNAKVVVEAGVGVRVKRGGDGRYDGEELGKVVREVVVGKEGEGVRRKAMEMGRMLREKGDEVELNHVALKLRQLCSDGTTGK